MVGDNTQDVLDEVWRYLESRSVDPELMDADDLAILLDLYEQVADPHDPHGHAWRAAMAYGDLKRGPFLDRSYDYRNIGADPDHPELPREIWMYLAQHGVDVKWLHDDERDVIAQLYHSTDQTLPAEHRALTAAATFVGHHWMP